MVFLNTTFLKNTIFKYYSLIIFRKLYKLSLWNFQSNQKQKSCNILKLKKINFLVLISKKHFWKSKIRFLNLNMRDMEKTSECEIVYLNKFYNFPFKNTTFAPLIWILYASIYRKYIVHELNAFYLKNNYNYMLKETRKIKMFAAWIYILLFKISICKVLIENILLNWKQLRQLSRRLEF